MVAMPAIVRRSVIPRVAVSTRACMVDAVCQLLIGLCAQSSPAPGPW